MAGAGTAPVVARTRAELAAVLAERRADRDRSLVALVPTMGALHVGHASLVRLARERVSNRGAVVVSIFVNPLQFGPNEDLDRYPRTFEEDLRLCSQERVDVVFAPTVAEIYPSGVPAAASIGHGVTVDPGPLGDVLEGSTRPGHFRGVLTIVAKLFGLVEPDLAVFGEKDFQQLVLIRRMVSDLCLPVEIVGAPTAREEDGLARSSRNRYLDAAQRAHAGALSRALRSAADAASRGVGPALAAAEAELRTTTPLDLDYFEIRAPDLSDLPAEVAAGTPARALVAARIGATRLIDNLGLTIGDDARDENPPGQPGPTK